MGTKTCAGDPGLATNRPSGADVAEGLCQDRGGGMHLLVNLQTICIRNLYIQSYILMGNPFTPWVDSWICLCFFYHAKTTIIIHMIYVYSLVIVSFVCKCKHIDIPAWGLGLQIHFFIWHIKRQLMTYVKSGTLPNLFSKGISFREGETNWGPSIEDTDESSRGDQRGQILGFCKYILWFGFEVSKFAGTGSWYGRSVLKHVSLSLSLYLYLYTQHV